ncbi:MAG: hypothetical protein ChlgKO_14710 [Chlamydiales bacterium]
MKKFTFSLSLLFASALISLPSGSKVDHGKVEIKRSGDHLLVQSGKRAVINWDSFSIEKGERALFVMKNSQSTLLNRVTGGNKSEILGRMESNGNIYLLNQNGILFGKDCQINVNSLVASTLDVLDEDFLRGQELRFFNEEKGSIVNLGEIGGNAVFLLAGNVDNRGTIQAKHVGLATGSRILLRPEGMQRIFIEASNPEESIDHSGKISALTTEIKNNSPYVLAVRTNGSIETMCAENRDGKVFLVAENGTLDIDGNVRANHVEMQADNILVNGLLDVSTNEAGGKVFLHGEKTVSVYGDINARGKKEGGYVEICSNNAPGLRGFIDRRAENGLDGLLYIDPQNVFIDPLGADSASGQSFGFMSGANQSIPGSAIATALIGGPLTIQCNTDCTIRDTITSASANTFTIQCGKTCTIDPAFALSFAGDFTIVINDAGAIPAERDPGIANFNMDAGSSITMSGGANFSQTVGTFGGVQEGFVTLTTATITGGSGSDISLEGVHPGVAPAASFNDGVSIITTSSISTTGSGSITVTGTGGSGIDQNRGIFIDDNSTLEVETGGITLTGTGGGGTGGSNSGIVISNSSMLESTTSTLELNGTGGTGVGMCNGVVLNDSTIMTDTGAITITGSGDAAATDIQNIGVTTDSNALITSNSGDITITGVGGGGTSEGTGIEQAGTVTSTLGDILLDGTGGSSTSGNVGVVQNGTVQSTGTLSSTASTITIQGLGGTGSGSDGIASSGGTTTSVAGDILFEGQGGDIGDGIMLTGADITSTGTGSDAANIQLTGDTAASGTGFGCIIGLNSTVSVIDGNLSITGTGQSSDGTVGTSIQRSVVQSTGDGLIDIEGFGNESDGVTVLQTGALVTSSSGKITILGQGTSSSDRGVGVSLSGGIVGTGSADVEINGIGFALNRFGVSVSGAGSRISTEAGTLDVTGEASGAGAAGVFLFSGGSIFTSSGTMNMRGETDAGATFGPGIRIESGTVSTGTGTMNVTGIAAGTSVTNDGIRISSGGSLFTSSPGTATIVGEGSAAGLSRNRGILLTGAVSSIENQGAGVMNISGTGGGTLVDNSGFFVEISGAVTNASGEMNITGVGGAGNSSNLGIGFEDSTLTTTSGNVTLDGTGQGALTGNTGVSAVRSSITSQDGNLIFIGVGADGTTANHGIDIDDSSSVESTGGGNLSLTGTGGSGDTGCRGIFIQDNSEVVASGTGTITFLGTGGNTAGDSWGINITDNSLVSSQSGAINATGVAGGATEEGIRMDLVSLIQSNAGATIDIRTMSDFVLSDTGKVVGSTGAVTIVVDRDFLITGGATAGDITGVDAANANVSVTTVRDLILTGGSAGGTGAQIGSLSSSSTSQLLFPSIGRDLVLDAASADSFAIIGHGSTGGAATNLSGEIRFTTIGGSASITGGAGAGGDGLSNIGHINATTINGDIFLSTRDALTLTGGAAAASADARIGHLNSVTTTSSNMTVIADTNVILTTQTGQTVITNLSTVPGNGLLRIVVDNANPVFPAFGATGITIGSGSDVSTASGELRIYTVQPSQNTINEDINGVTFVPTPLDVDDETNQYGVYFPGGTFINGAPFRVYYKIGEPFVEPVEEFVLESFTVLAIDLSELEDRLPIFRYMRLANYPWHHPSFCNREKRRCDPGFDPYHSFIFEDNTYWIASD